MIDRPATDAPGDEELVAYIDGELSLAERASLERKLRADPALTERLEFLKRGSRDFRPALDLLLEAAPSERLQAMLAEAKVRSSVSRPRAANWRWAMAIAAALFLFVAGGTVGVLLPRAFPALATRGPVENWRSAVAEYVVLYTPDTFAGIPSDTAVQTRQLNAIGGKLGLPLDPQKVALPGFDMKGAILFSFKDKPLAQIAYLSPESGLLAFCIINNGKAGDEPPHFEEREGQNIVFWQKDGRGYLIIGKSPRPAMEAMAASLAERV